MRSFGRATWARIASGGEIVAQHLDGNLPEALGALRVERVCGNSIEGVRRHLGLVAVLEVAAADAGEEARGGDEHGCRRALFRRLPNERERAQSLQGCGI